MSNPTINDVRDALHSHLESILVTDDLLQLLKSYPTIAAAEGYSPLGMLASMGTSGEGGSVNSSTINNDRDYYDFALIVAAKCEKGVEATWQTAEDKLNSVESLLKDNLNNLTSDLWTKVIYRQPSTRPPAPPEFPYWRWAEIYLRVLLH